MRKFEKISYEEFCKNVDGSFYANVKIPQRSTKKSAGYDFYLPYDINIPSHSKVLVYSGIKALMENDEFLMIVIRSSLGIKKNLKLSNQIGIIDSDYYNQDNEGHIIIALDNMSDEFVTLKQGERVAQGIFLKYLTVDDDKTINENRLGGIGSTNK